MLSLLDYRNISTEMFKKPRMIRDHGSRHQDPPWVQRVLKRDGDWNIQSLDQLFYDFRDLSLLQTSEDSSGPIRKDTIRISMHPLVAEWVQTRANANPSRKQECLLQAILVVASRLKASLTIRMIHYHMMPCSGSSCTGIHASHTWKGFV